MYRQLTLGDKTYDGIYVTTQDEFTGLINRLRHARAFAWDTETTGLRPFHGDRIVGMSFYFPDDCSAWYISFRHPDSNNWHVETLRAFDMMFERGQRIVTWNGKFDLLFAHVDGFNVLSEQYRIEDGQIALHLLDENRKRRNLNYRLKDVANQFIAPDAKDEQFELKGELRKRGLSAGAIGRLPAELVCDYAMMDTVLTWELSEFFAPHMNAWHVTELYAEQNRFLQTALLRMEINGMLVDRELCEQRIQENKQAVYEVLTQIHKLAGYPLNPNSPAQVTSWLGLPNAQRETLEEANDPRADLIVDHKFLTKAVGTFYAPYLEWSAGDGRIHSSYNIAGPVTGRLSCYDPNLQQVPREKKENQKHGYEVKDVFIAPEGMFMVGHDYKALEFRLACHFAQATRMADVLASGGDPHQMTADQLGIDRQSGKTANFSFAYGMGAETGAKRLHCTEEEAQAIIDSWHEQFPEFKRALYATADIADTWRDRDGNPSNQQGNRFRYIRLMDGRCRRFMPGDSTFPAWNSLIQGTAGVVARRGIQRVVDRFKDNSWFKPILTVHDSFYYYVPEEAFKDVYPVVVGLMSDFPEFHPPMGVDTQWGKDWGHMESIK